MKVWITKYALTQGIYEAEAGQSQFSDMVLVGPIGAAQALRQKDWHLTESDAKTRANEMVVAKIKSLQKQIEKLRQLEF